MGDDAAHRNDGAFELLERSWVLRIAPDEVYFLCQLLHHLGYAEQALGGRQGTQRIAHFGEPALDCRERGTVGTCMAAVVDPVGELAHLVFERLDRSARHRLPKHQANLGEIIAQGIDGLVEAARLLEDIDLRIDLAQMLPDAGPLLRARAGPPHMLVAIGIVAARGVVWGSRERARLDPLLRSAIKNDSIEPFADRHAGTARGLPRGLARLPPDSC